MSNSRKQTRTQVLNAAQINETLERLSRRIARDYNEPGSMALVGIRTRGLPIAHRVARLVAEHRNASIPVGALDITLYRDDLDTLLPQGRIDATEIPFDINNKTLILFDDVLHTGRTVRAAVDHLMALGRPRAIFLAVLIDRGGRELPIEPKLVGKKITPTPGGTVQVLLKEVDGRDAVWISGN
jgi:pyrimidine operon attenuation protein/uracil phosphoribosyltransferase